MKNVWLMLGMLVCIFTSCSDGGDNEPITPPSSKPEVSIPEITIDSSILSNGLNFEPSQSEKSISFSASSDWTLTIAETRSGTAWCTASPTSGTKGNATVKFTTIANTDAGDRSVAVTIKAGAASKTFTITQKGSKSLLVTTKKYELSQDGGEIEIEVKANIEYQMEVSESAKEWITEVAGRAIETHKHVFNVAASEEAVKREGEIYFKSGDIVETVKVYQAGEAILLLSKNEFTVSHAGETISVDVISNVEYGVQMPNVEWLSEIAAGRAMSSHALQFCVVANDTHDERSAEIVFYDKNSGLKEVLKVVQKGQKIVMSEKVVEVKNEGEVFDVEINDIYETGIESYPFNGGMVKVELIDYSNHTIKFSVTPNNNIEKRETLIFFVDKNSVARDTITVIQPGLAPAQGFEMISLGDNLSMHSKGLALQYSGVKDFNDFWEAKYDEAICQKIYSKFEDAFDFIFFLYNTSGDEFSYGGFSYPINRNISGIGRDNVNISSRFGTNGRLRNINHLTLRTSIFSGGPFLHELVHHWGAAYIGQEYATPSGTYGTESHWGTTDINGVLGGFDYNTLQRNVDGNSKKYKATAQGILNNGFGGFSQELSSAYYAPIELYLMGLIPASEVPDMHVFKNVIVEEDTAIGGVFYADEEITYTIEDFIEEYGERVPDYQSSQKDFRALVVVVTDEPVSAEHWTLIERDILKQEKQGTVNDRMQTNFWEATGGRATLTMSGIDKFLK